MQQQAMLRNILWLSVAFILSNSLALSVDEEDFEYLKKELKEYVETKHKEMKTRQNELEERVEKLEELAKIGTLRSCAEYAQYGLKSSGLYLVDPDGPLLGHPPFQVFCNFDAGGCVGGVLCCVQ